MTNGASNEERRLEASKPQADDGKDSACVRTYFVI